MNSIELYKPNNSALNRLSKFFSRIPIKSKNGVSSININHKRNSMIKKYKTFLENNKNEEKFNKSYNLYIESLNDYMMNKIYKRVKLEIATEYEKNILSEYYYILKLKEEHYEEYNYRKQKFLIDLDYENIESDEKIFENFKITYEYIINKIYGNLLKLNDNKDETNRNEYILNVLEEYNDDKYVKFILKEKDIEPYIYDIKEDSNDIEIATSNKQRYEILLNITEKLFIEQVNNEFIDYINGLISKEKEKIESKNKRRISLKNKVENKKIFVKIKEKKKMKKENNKSFIKIAFIAIAIIIVLFLVFNLLTQKNKKLNIDGSNINFTYSSLDYKQIEEDQDEIKLESKEDKIIIKSYSNTDTKYDVLKEYKKMVYNGEEKQYKNVLVLSYKENDNNHVYMLKISDNAYIEITVSKKEDCKKTLDELINKKCIQNILNSVKVTK